MSNVSIRYALEVGPNATRQRDKRRTLTQAIESAWHVFRLARKHVRIVKLITIEAPICTYENGYVDAEREATKITINQELKLYSSMGVAPPKIYSPEELDAALEEYDKITSEPSYLGGTCKAQLYRVTTIVERIKPQ